LPGSRSRIRNSEVIIRNQVGTVDPYDSGDDVFYNFYLLEKYYEGDENDKRGLTRDFVGPSIDTGFRLGTLSTPRKFTISLDLALLLVSVTPSVSIFSPLYVRYDGRQPLKGVLGGRPYPIFWVDMLHDDVVLDAEDKLAGPKTLSEEHIRHFCEKFLAEHEDYMIRPFIYENIDPNFGVIPQIYRDRLRKLSDDWPNAKTHKEIEIKAIANEAGPAPDPAKVEREASIPDFKVPQTSLPQTAAAPSPALKEESLHVAAGETTA